MNTPTPRHLQFLRDLDDSQPAVWFIARQLQAWGYPVRINPYRKAPTADVHTQYTDDGDLEVHYKVEVKHLSVNFSDRQSWPYPDAIVDGQEQFDRKFPQPKFYIFVSADYEAVGIIDTSSKQFWTVEPRQDENGASKLYYICPLTKVVFKKTTVRTS